MKKTSIFILLFTLLISLVGCFNKDELDQQSDFISVMGTTVVVEIYSDDSTIISEVRDVFEYYNQLTSNFERNEFINTHKYYDLNNIYLINENAGVEPVKVDTALIEILEYSLELYELTEGYFHPGIGHLVDFWKSQIDEYLFMDFQTYTEKLAEAALIEVPTIDKIVIDKEASTVFLTDDTVKLDLGSLAKGYALDKAFKLVQSKGIKKYYIDAGKSSMAYGTHPQDRPYNLGIKDNENKYENQMIGILKVQDSSISTSGSAEQFLPVRGQDNKTDRSKMIHHIVSPFTKKPENLYHSVTILDDDAGLADALTTAVFLMSQEEAISFLNKNKINYILYDLEYNVLTNLDKDTFKVSDKLE